MGTHGSEVARGSLRLATLKVDLDYSLAIYRRDIDTRKIEEIETRVVSGSLT